MPASDRFIEQIVAASRIPRGARRREVLRELQEHVEDFVLAARQNGRPDQEIERLLMDRFGDPQQIAEQFASVYRRERAALHVCVFLLSTLVVSILVSVTAISMQAGIAFGFGESALQLLGSRHTTSEALDILATVAAYVGLLSLERFFGRALPVLAAITAGLIALFAFTGLPARFVVFGFLNAMLLRAVQLHLRHPVARFCAVAACFGALGAMFFHPPVSAIAAASWLIMASAYQLMIQVAERVDRALLGGL